MGAAPAKHSISLPFILSLSLSSRLWVGEDDAGAGTLNASAFRAFETTHFETKYVDVPSGPALKSRV